MFPLLFTALRNAAIRYGDLALRLLTLETLQLPDRMFAPAPSALPCADAARLTAADELRRSTRRREAGLIRSGSSRRSLPEARVREAQRRIAARSRSSQARVPRAALSGAAGRPCPPAATRRPTQLHPNAARSGVAAADGRLARPDTPAGRRRP